MKTRAQYVLDGPCASRAANPGLISFIQPPGRHRITYLPYRKSILQTDVSADRGTGPLACVVHKHKQGEEVPCHHRSLLCCVLSELSSSRPRLRWDLCLRYDEKHLPTEQAER